MPRKIVFTNSTSTVPSLSTISFSSEKEFGLTIYPNPASVVLHYNFKNSENSKTAVLSLIALNGNIVYTKNLNLTPSNNKGEINVRNVDSGTYILKVTVNSKRNSVKVMIK